MYITRRLSEYQKNPSDLSLPLYTGVLLIQDEESRPTCCFGSCYDPSLKGLPFPQNAKLAVRYETGGESSSVYRDPVVFIPVFDQPLSSNRYYVIRRRGKHSGEASASAREEDRVPYCFCCSHVPDAKPQPPDPYDINQQFEICQRKSSKRYFYAKSVAPDGVPPQFLKRKGWTVEYSTSENYGLSDDAKGLNAELRSILPDLNASVVVGKWYVPFIFVKERGDAKDQIKSSTYYSVTLEQRWEEVFSCENINKGDPEVVVDVDFDAEVVKLEGKEIAQESKTAGGDGDGDGFVWFGATSDEREGKKIGLGSAVVERMRWEEERFGWRSEGGARAKRVKREERCEGGGVDWKSYHCYVMVESFVLRRRDGSLFLTYEFRHADKLRSKWD